VSTCFYFQLGVLAQGISMTLHYLFDAEVGVFVAMFFVQIGWLDVQSPKLATIRHQELRMIG
jgi:hypothetical protein